MIRRLRTEDGFTVVTAMFVVLLGLLFTTAAIGQAISTESSVRRDGSSKRALQAAKAGVEAARYRMTALAEGLVGPGGTSRCPVVDAATGTYTFQAPTLSYGGEPWCAPVQERIGSGATATYWVSDDLQPARRMTDHREIVATGAAPGAGRRVKTDWMMTDIRQLFWDFTVFSDETLNLYNQADVGSTTIRGNAGSNGDINLNSPETRVYGDATPGPGSTAGPAGQIIGNVIPATAPLNLPLVDPIEAAVNDNARICSPTCPSGVTFTNGDLSIAGDDVAIVGNTFLLCSLSLSGTGNPTIAFQPLDANRPVRIFIRDPATCGGTRPTHVLEVGQAPTVTVASTAYPSIQVFIAGDPSQPSTVDIGNRYSLPITLYAPASNVTLSNNGSISGGIAARQVTMVNSTEIVYPSGGGSLDLEVPPDIDPGDFVECTTSAAAAQNLTDGC